MLASHNYATAAHAQAVLASHMQLLQMPRQCWMENQWTIVINSLVLVCNGNDQDKYDRRDDHVVKVGLIIFLGAIFKIL